MAQRKQAEVQTCDVVGCKAEAARSVSIKKVGEAGLKVDKKMGNAHLCKDHYRDYRKATKKDRELERLGW
jgi:hypothetical protein